MAKNLVIVESPTKVKSIGKYLGKDYVVSSSKGHIRDLSTKGKFGLGVDVDNHFKPDYKTIKGKKSVITELKKEAENPAARTFPLLLKFLIPLRRISRRLLVCS